MPSKTKYIKIISSTLIAGAFLFLAFVSDDSKSSSSSSSSTTTSSSTKNTRTVYSGGYAVEIDLTPPTGYEEGASCSDCDGGGVTNYNGSDMICPGCNGKGFHWRKK